MRHSDGNDKSKTAGAIKSEAGWLTLCYYIGFRSFGIVGGSFQLEPVQLDDVHVVVAVGRLPGCLFAKSGVDATLEVDDDLVLVEAELLFLPHPVQ